MVSMGLGFLYDVYGKLSWGRRVQINGFRMDASYWMNEYNDL